LNQNVARKLQQLVDEAEGIRDDQYPVYDKWLARIKAFLSAVADISTTSDFDSLSNPHDWTKGLAMQLGYLEGLIAIAETQTPSPTEGNSQSSTPKNTKSLLPSTDSRKVFIVHGHDDAAKDGVARFIDKVGLQPIILHEQANAGRVIIEKFETYSADVSFAVVLLTPDDVGSAAANNPQLRPRARQNVIMELGYFMGKLGRSRVCALHKGNVELPSDYQAVLYVEMDAGGAWKNRIAQELIESKISINLSGLLG
jgi:predicted nucleotide-binding protein